VQGDAPLAIVISSTFAHCRELFTELRRELHELDDCNPARLLISQPELKLRYGSNTLILRSVASSQDSLRGKVLSHVLDATFPQTLQQQEEHREALKVLLPAVRK
jgi:hypothetical protein